MLDRFVSPQVDGRGAGVGGHGGGRDFAQRGLANLNVSGELEKALGDAQTLLGAGFEELEPVLVRELPALCKRYGVRLKLL
jgi:hypothetical protein